MQFLFSLNQIIAIHDTLIQEFGGSYGIRDQGLLESAIQQPFQSFSGEDLYPTIFDKAAAIAFFISENQPFIDGNKRTAASAAGVFLDVNGHELNCPSGQLYDVMMQLANKQISREELSKWFQKYAIKRKSRR